MERESALLGGDLLTREVFLHELVIRSCDRLVESVLVLVADLYVFLGELGFASRALLIEVVKLHRNEIDELEFSVSLDRNESRTKLDPETVAQCVEYTLEACFGVVVFVDEECAGNLCLRGEIPRELGAYLDAGFAVDDDDGSVCGTDAASHFTLEIKRAGGVEQIDLDGVPGERCDRKSDGKAALYLFGVVVAYGVSFGNLAEAVAGFSGIQHCLGE